jgi:hypothetical protein
MDEETQQTVHDLNELVSLLYSLNECSNDEQTIDEVRENARKAAVAVSQSVVKLAENL